MCSYSCYSLISFFRINSFFQAIGLLIVLLALKFIYGFGTLPLLKPELEWLMVGEKVAQGFIPYKEVWTFSSPIITLLYALVSGFGPQNLLHFDLVAVFLVFVQGLLFNQVCNNRKLFLEKTFLPGFLYVLLMCVSFDMTKLTPPLLGNTFLILVLNSVIKQLETTQKSSNFGFEIGFFIGLAALVHLPLLSLVLWALICLLLFSSFDFRQFILVLLGFSMPILAFGIYFSFVGGLTEFRQQWLESILDVKVFSFSNFSYALLVFAAPTVLGVLGLLRLFNISRYNNYQTKTHQSFFFLGITVLVSIILSDNTATYQFAIFVPVLSFFVTAFFIHLRSLQLTEGLFLVLLSIITFGAFLQSGKLKSTMNPPLKNLRVEKLEPNPYSRKTILILGDDNSAYFGSKPSTKYLNWSISKQQLKNPNTYQEVVAINESFRNDLPQVILDQENVVPRIFELLPDLEKRYRKEKAGTYVLK